MAVGLALSFRVGAAYAAEPSSAGKGTTGAAVKPQAAIAKAKSPSPPANASQKAAAGKGKAVVNTAGTPGETDSFWVESIDIDGDGNVEEVDVLYDDEDKVLFLFADGEFTCTNGKRGEGAMLMAVNQEGNSRGKPAGSGWYVVELDATECEAERGGVYRCRFDAAGTVTACGIATIDEKND
jgi:hypothetical protein